MAMWQKLLGRCIYHSTKGIRVYQNLFFRWLRFDSPAMQTLISRRRPFKPALSYINLLILAAKLQPGDCCMFGLGGGGAAHALYPLLRNMKFTVVESNAEIIRIAKRYFMIGALENLEIEHQDAREYARECEHRYKHLLIDIYNAKQFPEHCNTESFFADCKKLLEPEGILTLNLANRQEQWPIFQIVKALFPSTTLILSVPKTENMIILATKSKTIKPLLEQFKANNQFKQLNWDPDWGYIAR